MSETEVRLTQGGFPRFGSNHLQRRKRNFINPKNQRAGYTKCVACSVFFYTCWYSFHFRSLKCMMNPDALQCAGAQFILFGMIFWPQDFSFRYRHDHIYCFVILFTVIYGRIFCGWACPQTIFMEMVFRRLNIGSMGFPPAKDVTQNAVEWRKDQEEDAEVRFILLDLFHCCQFLSWPILSGWISCWVI